MSAFGDTSGFLALLDADEANHASAAETWRALVSGDEPVYTTNYVAVETISLLRHRAGVRAVRRFCEDILAFVEIAWVDEQVHERAIAMVLASSRRGPSLVDCTSFEIMRRLRIPAAIAFDRHFAEWGYGLPKVSTAPEHDA